MAEVLAGHRTARPPAMARPRAVPFEPPSTWKTLSRLGLRQPWPEPFRGGEVEWLFCGTGAIYRGVRRLGLGPADVVLLPAYNCGSEVDAVLAAGARVAFYRVGTNLQADVLDLVRRSTPQTRAVLVIHYFGFPQAMEPILEWARPRGIVVIEDCAHAWLSQREGRHLGTMGDLAVFSPRKSLPLTDGGALLGIPARAACPEPQPPEWKHAIREGLDILGRSMGRPNGLPVGKALWRIVRRWSPGGVAPLSRMGSDDFASVAPRLDWGMSGLAGALLRATDHAEMVRRRRANFLHLLERFPRRDAVTPLFDHLPEGVSPLYFPVIASGRDALHARLEERGVGTHRFWTWSHPAIPAGEHPEAVSLRARLLALPVHQGLDEADLSFVAEALDAATR